MSQNQKFELLNNQFVKLTEQNNIFNTWGAQSSKANLSKNLGFQPRKHNVLVIGCCCYHFLVPSTRDSFPFFVPGGPILLSHNNPLLVNHWGSRYISKESVDSFIVYHIRTMLSHKNIDNVILYGHYPCICFGDQSQDDYKKYLISAEERIKHLISSSRNIIPQDVCIKTYLEIDKKTCK